MKLFLYGLTILFIGLKLSGVIAWSWLLVLSPLFLIYVLAPLLVFIFAIIFVSQKPKRF